MLFMKYVTNYQLITSWRVLILCKIEITIFTYTTYLFIEHIQVAILLRINITYTHHQMQMKKLGI